MLKKAECRRHGRTLFVLLLAVISMALLIIPRAEGAETGDVCVDHYQPRSVCTANDVRVESFTPVPGTFSGCTNGIGSATFDVKVSAIGSPDRYDIGLFFSQDGTSALTGTSCYHDFLSGNLSTTRPTIDTDADGYPDSTGSVTNPYWNGDGDTCGDVSSDSNAYRTVTLTFACVDLNGDGLIDIPVCSSWDNQASNNCTDVTNAYPRTKSKCDCEVVPSGLPISVPAISVVKNPADQAVLSGNDATFSIEVTNTGSDAPLQNIVVTDPQCTTLTGPTGDTNNDSILQSTEIWTYNCTTTNVTSDFTNTVTVKGTPPSGPDVTATATANVTVNTALITVVKSPSTQTVASGGTATFTITVTNPGDVPLDNIQVVDPQCATLTGPTGDTNNDTILQTSETWTYNCTTTNVTADFINNVTVSGTVSGGPTVSDSDTAQVTVFIPPAPMIVVTKTPSNQTIVSGGTAAFTITVTNPGNVPLSNIRVVDPECTSLTGPTGDTNNDTILQTTETWTYNCTKTNVTLDFTNTVTATGTPPSGPDVSRTATAQVTVVSPSTPAIVATKLPSNQSVVSGGTATFTITVTNPTEIDLSNIQVIDPHCTTLTGPTGDTNSDHILQSTETWIYNCVTTNVTSDFTNTVTATGTPPEGPDVLTTATARVSVLTPAILTSKTPSTQSVLSGGSATFTITVTNPGDVPLGNIQVVDPQCTTLTGPTGDTNNDTILQTTETWTYNCTTTNVTAGFTNIVTVSGTVAGGPTISDSASAQVTVVVPGPPTAVPTMTEWGMILFVVLAGFGAMLELRRKRRT